MIADRTAATALALVLGPVTACAPVARDPVVGEGRVLAHRVVSGTAGPFARVTVTLTKPSGEMAGPFAGTIDVGNGRELELTGPDEPTAFFVLEANAVLFVPIDAEAATNGVVILYDASQIGPGHGTQHRALVYRIATDAATRVPDLEARVEGAFDAATVRRRLAPINRRVRP